MDRDGEEASRCGRAVRGSGGSEMCGDKRSFFIPLTVRTTSSVSPVKAMGAARYPSSDDQCVLELGVKACL